MLVTVNCSRFAFVVVTTEHVPLPSVVHIATFPNRSLCCCVKSCARPFYAPRSISSVEAKTRGAL